MIFMRSAMMAAVMFLAVCTVAKAQEYTYEFNRNGELQKGAPEVLLSGSTVSLKIDFDSALFLNGVHTVQLNVLNALIFWNERLAALQNTKPRPDFLDDVDTLIDNLQRLYDALNGKSLSELLALAPDYLCKTKLKAEENPFKYTPSPKVVIAGLCRQFRAVMKCGKKDCESQIPLCMTVNFCQDLFDSGSCKINNTDAVIAIYKLDALRNLTIDWYNSRISLFDYYNIIYLDHLITKDPVYKSVSAFLQTYSKLDTGKITDDSCSRIQQALGKLEINWPTAVAKRYDDSMGVALQAFSWILNFSWMNKIAFNPFGFTNAELYRALKSPSGNDAKTADIDTIAINHVDSFIAHRKIDSITDPKEVRLFLDILAKRDSIKFRTDSVATAKTKDTQTSSGKTETANQQALLAFQQVGVLRNRVVTLYSDNKDSLFTIRNYYFNKDVDKRKFRYEIPDNERVILAIHNLPGPDTVRISSNVVAYNEQTTIASSGVSAMQGLTTSLLPNSLLTRNKDDEFDAAAPARVPDVIPTTVPDCRIDIQNRIQSLNHRIRRLKVFDSLYSVTQLPPLSLQKIYNDSAQLRTRNLMPDGGIKAPFEEDYKLYVKDTGKTAALVLIDSSFYKTRRRRLAELALGFAYSVSYERQVNLDSANNNYNVKNVENKLQYVVGIKLHLLRKIYWGNDHFIGTCGANDWPTISERLSLFLGVSLPDPTNYLYSGIGVDLIPGLNINGGVQWYKYNKYTIANNAILDQSTIYKPGYYVSVTTDPLLFVTLITTFFK